MRKTLTAALAALVVAATAMPLAAEDAKPTAEKATTAKPAPEKKVSAQQQRMKTCAAKWKDEKATKNVKGRDAYRAFMSSCLKG